MKNLIAVALFFVGLLSIVNTQTPPSSTSPCFATAACADCLALVSTNLDASPMCDYCYDGSTPVGKCIPIGYTACTTVKACPVVDPCSSYTTSASCTAANCIAVTGTSCASTVTAIQVFGGCVSASLVANAPTTSFCGVQYLDSNTTLYVKFVGVPVVNTLTYSSFATVNTNILTCCNYNPNTDPCATVACNQNQVCTSGRCVCAVGYAGTYCNIKTCSPNDPNQCSGNGICTLITDLDGTAYRCNCTAQYYTGAQCEVFQLPSPCLKSYPNADAIFASDTFCYCYFNPTDTKCTGCNPSLTYTTDSPCYCKINPTDFNNCCFLNTTFATNARCFCYWNPSNPNCCTNPVADISGITRCCLPTPSPLDQVCYCRAFPFSDVCCNNQTAQLATNKACYCKFNPTDTTNCCTRVLTSALSKGVCCDSMATDVCKCAFAYYDNIALCSPSCNDTVTLAQNKACYCSIGNRLITDVNCCNIKTTYNNVAVTGAVSTNIPLCCDSVVDTSPDPLKLACCSMKSFPSVSPLRCKCAANPSTIDCCDANTPFTVNPACFCNNYPQNSLCCNSDVSYSIYPECYCKFHPTDDLCCPVVLDAAVVVTADNLRCYCKRYPNADVCCSGLTNLAYQCCNPDVTNYDPTTNKVCFCKNNPDDTRCCNQQFAATYSYDSTPNCFCALNPFDARCCNDSAGRPCCDFVNFNYDATIRPDCACRDPATAAKNPNCTKPCNDVVDPTSGKPIDRICFCNKNPTSFRCCLADKTYVFPAVISSDSDTFQKTCFCLYNQDCRCDNTCVPSGCDSDPSPAVGSRCYCKQNFNNTVAYKTSCCPATADFSIDPRCFCLRNPTDVKCDPTCVLTVDGVCDNTNNFCAKYPTALACFCKLNPTDAKCTSPCPISNLGTSNCTLVLYCRKNPQDAACNCIINPAGCSNWNPSPPPKGYCDNTTTTAATDTDCYCLQHIHADECACRLMPDSRSCYCARNPTDITCTPPTPATVTVTINPDGSITLTSSNGDVFIITTRSDTDPNENINNTFSGDPQCAGINIKYFKLIEFRDLNNNNQIDPTDSIVKETDFNTDISGGDSGVFTGSTTVGGTVVSNVGRSGSNIDIEHFLSSKGVNLYSDPTLNVPQDSLESFFTIKDYVSSQPGTKLCVAGSICICPKCKVSVDNAARIITIDCGVNIVKVFYQKAFVGGTQIDVNVVIDATADANGCYGFVSCFNTYNAVTLAWDPYVQTTTTSSQHAAASTIGLSFLTVLFAVLAYFFKY